MSPLTVIPDAEVLIGGWLRTHPDIMALDARVAPRTPDSTSKPWIRVTVIDDGDSTVGHDHLIEYMVQLDCYAGNTAMAAHTAQAEASLLYRTARAVLKAKEGMQVDSVVVTSVECRGTRVPDTSAEPARERLDRDAVAVALDEHGGARLRQRSTSTLHRTPEARGARALRACSARAACRRHPAAPGSP